MDLNELRDKHYKWTCSNGQHDVEYHDNHWKMLIIAEISGAVQADRENRHADMEGFIERSKLKPSSLNEDDCSERYFKQLFERFIKNTVEDKLADVILQLMDYAGMLNYNINICSFPTFEESYHNVMILYKDFTGFTYDITERVTRIDNSRSIVNILSCGMDPETYKRVEAGKVKSLIYVILQYCVACYIDIMWHIEQKMKYNQTQPILNGKLY